MSDISNTATQGSVESLDNISSSSVSIDFSIETVSSDDIAVTWNTDNNFDNLNLSEQEEMEILRQSIIDISLQEDIETLDLIGLDEISDLSLEDKIAYKNHLLNNADITPPDLVNMINTHLLIINIAINNIHHP
jgi:hypothetical protein